MKWIVQLVGLAGILLLVGCQVSERDVTARLDIDRGTVLVDGVPASSGQALLRGQRVSTRGNGQARIRFFVGSSEEMTLVLRSSAKLTWPERVSLAAGATVDAVVGSGVYLIRKLNNWNLRISSNASPVANLEIKSRAVVRFEPGRVFEASLAEGNMRLLSPERQNVAVGQTIRVLPGDEVVLRTLSRSEVERLESQLQAVGLGGRTDINGEDPERPPEETPEPPEDPIDEDPDVPTPTDPPGSTPTLQ